MADLGTYPSWDEFIKKHKNGKAGDIAVVGGRQYVWSDMGGTWVPAYNGTQTNVPGTTSYTATQQAATNSAGYVPTTQGGNSGGTGFPQTQPLTRSRVKNLDFNVFSGENKDVLYGVSGTTMSGKGSSPDVMNASDYFETWFKKSKDEVKALQTKLQAMNVLGSNFTPGIFDSATQQALGQQLVLMSQYANPDHNLKTWFGSDSSKLFPNGGQSSTSVNIQRHEYSADTLKEDVNQAYQNAVGRQATAKEITDAVNAVNEAAKKNPSKTVTTSGGKTTTSVSSGGVNAGQMITDQAQADPEFGSYQAATTYFDAMLKALNGTVGRGA